MIGNNYVFRLNTTTATSILQVIDSYCWGEIRGCFPTLVTSIYEVIFVNILINNNSNNRNNN